MSEIVVFDLLETDFTGNGAAVLCPTSAKLKTIAGGAYTFEMEHPLDPWGKWTHLQEEAIVRLPVPREEIANAFAGQDCDVYVTTGEAELREGPGEPTAITYPAWSQYNTYSVGSKVSSQGKNYKCIYWDGNSTQRAERPGASDWWKSIPTSTGGYAAVATLPAGTELYYVSTYDSDWYQMSTYYGVTGYVKATSVTFLEHRSASEMKDRVITEQLFRIKVVTVNKKSRSVSVSGVHVSADLNGIQVKDISITQGSPAMAISRVVDNLLWDYAGSIGTNLSADDHGTFTGDFKGKSGIYCLLDPDSGIVPEFDARYTRDNWDIFVLERDDAYKGYQIRYAKNANGINWEDSTEGLITRVMPTAKDEKGETLYLPETYVDSTHISEYPVIYMETLSVSGQVGKAKDDDETETWTEADLLAEMRTKAGERFSVDQVDVPSTTVTVQLIPLEGTAEYAWLNDVTGVLLYDRVRVIDEEVNRQVDLLVSELEYDCIKRRVVGIKLVSSLNSVSRSVTGYSITNASIGSEKLKDDVREGIVEEAVSKMPEFSGSGSSVGVIDNLTSTSTTDALSANMGRELDSLKADKTDTVLYTTLSCGRRENSTVGAKSIAYGWYNTASSDYTVAIGRGNTASAEYAYAAGYENTASGKYSHAEGWGTGSSGTASHTEGIDTGATSSCAHAEGSITLASGDASHAEGAQCQATGDASHAEGGLSVASGRSSHAEGSSTASGASAHAEGASTLAKGLYSHAEGQLTKATGDYGSHAEGKESTASGDYASHAEGSWTTASGTYGAHAEGKTTTASGNYGSHAEGDNTSATGVSGSHAEGYYTTASGQYGSHAEGLRSVASGSAAHAEGRWTIAKGNYQHTEGKYNIEDTTNTYAHIIGNGSADSDRSNCHTVRWNGTAEYAGDVYAYACGGAQPLSISGLARGTAYVATTDGKAPAALSAGQYIWWNNQLYKTTAAIASGSGLSVSNVTAVSGGGFNDLAADRTSKTWANLLALYTWGDLV